MKRSVSAPSVAGVTPVAANPPDLAGRSGRARATGKAILFGEHAVVYGHPAIAIPLHGLSVRAQAVRTSGPVRLESPLFTGPVDRAPARLRPPVTAIMTALRAAGASEDSGVTVRVHSDIPVERGLGSSAAVSAAIVMSVSAAFDRAPSRAQRHQLIQAAERAAHGTPSGLDAYAVVAQAPLWFEGGDVDPLAVARNLTFVVADTGVAGNTRAAVGGVRARRAEDPVRMDALLAGLGELSATGRDALAAGEPAAVGAAMTEAHELLGMLGVGDDAVDTLATAALRGGAHGAKLTGGGLGGCILAVAQDDDHAADLALRLREAGAAGTWITSLEGTA